MLLPVIYLFPVPLYSCVLLQICMPTLGTASKLTRHRAALEAAYAETEFMVDEHLQRDGRKLNWAEGKIKLYIKVKPHHSALGGQLSITVVTLSQWASCLLQGSVGL